MPVPKKKNGPLLSLQYVNELLKETTFSLCALSSDTL